MGQWTGSKAAGPGRRAWKSCICGLVGLFLLSSPALAHRLIVGGGGGVPIPSLAHGQMEVYARHWDDIMRLADQATGQDEGFRRVTNYARIQRAWCLWGLMPSALTDEDSPFNGCSHAYLAAARSLLDELQETAIEGSETQRLGQAVERDLVLSGSLLICGYSGETFNTADHIGPDWSLLPSHRPTLMVFGGLLALLLLLGGVMLARKSLRAGRPRSSLT